MERATEVFSPAVESLRNYRDLLDRVDALCLRTTEEFSTQVSCQRGCSNCGRHVSLSWVEAVTLALALDHLPEAQGEWIRDRARRTASQDPCPLLDKGACLLYATRPIVCRTHGIPLLTNVDGREEVVSREHNFRDRSVLPSRALIDLNLLNASLVTINNLFVSEVFHGRSPEQERLSIAEALLLDL